ncbi:MAG: UbiA family prenyltransferase [Promethearchaeia archaeon]
MSKRIDLLRLDYAFSVLIPIVLAIFLNDLNLFNYLDILIGFLFLAITGNVWNDVIDMRDPEEKDTLKRVEGYHPKEIFTIGMCSLLLGIALLLRTCIQNPINGILLILIIGMVLLYCVWLKLVPILNHILLGISHIVLPYFMIKIEADLALLSSEIELPLVLAFLFFGLTGQFVHEIIDRDALRKHLSLKGCQFVVWFFSILTIICGIWAFIIIPNYFFIPFLFLPLGTIYTFRKPTKSTKGVKDVGILIGNFLLLFFLTLVSLRMTGII